MKGYLIIGILFGLMSVYSENIKSQKISISQNYIAKNKSILRENFKKIKELKLMKKIENSINSQKRVEKAC